MSEWFRQVTGPRRAAARLVCFPHAGGTAAAFRGWGAHVPPDVEVLAVRYPGRQDRIAEPCVDTMEPLVAAVTAALPTDLPLVLFGHSMGASVAHEVTRALPVPPVLLAVSGRRPPHLLRIRDVQGDSAIIADVKRLGEANAEVLDHPELRDLILPAIRADYHLVRTYEPGSLPPVAVPIVAHTAEDDPEAPVSDMRGWAELTTAEFDLTVWSGGHFYLAAHEAELVSMLCARLGELVSAE
ncbi:thioesterase II family protein [Actinokineospora fastidiosa]|uniref:Thioesterase n=1 Tax=Actinokineospora fastidiosa TaxID=1816 RepID=A0A918GHM9_9PSEU|nr:thioesterase [Actinokineospora fastidiosa]GGS36316.1 thioesterase [Actinokineospora fastidiosa]